MLLHSTDDKPSCPQERHGRIPFLQRARQVELLADRKWEGARWTGTQLTKAVARTQVTCNKVSWRTIGAHEASEKKASVCVECQFEPGKAASLVEGSSSPWKMRLKPLLHDGPSNSKPRRLILQRYQKRGLRILATANAMCCATVTKRLKQSSG
jgi:hypothetical protein